MAKKKKPSGPEWELTNGLVSLRPPLEVPAPIFPTCQRCGFATAHEDHSQLIELVDGVCAWCASDIEARRQTTVPQRIVDWAVLARDLGVTS